MFQAFFIFLVLLVSMSSSLAGEDANKNKPTTSVEKKSISSSDLDIAKTEALAQQGDVEAMARLGAMYLGKESAQDAEKALAWFRKAAKGGHSGAELMIGDFYSRGLVVEQSDSKALEWIRKSALHGNAYGQARLGYMYLYGQGVEKDYQNANLWLQEAAIQGHVASQRLLGIIYAAGLGVEKDDKKAELWLKAAIERDDVIAQTLLGTMYLNGINGVTDYKQAMSLLEKAAESGHAKAQTEMGHIYYDGLGVSKNYNMADLWFGKAAAQGDVLAQFMEGQIVDFGLNGHTSSAEAASWYRKAAAQNYAPAQRELAVLYLTNKIDPSTKHEANDLLRAAAMQGDADSLFWMAYMYHVGTKVDENLILAYTFYKLASAKEISERIDARIAIELADLKEVLTTEQINEGEQLALTWKPGTDLPSKTRLSGLVQEIKEPEKTKKTKSSKKK